MIKSFSMNFIFCPDLTCVCKMRLQCQSLVDFQLGIKLDSFSFPDICTGSSKCHTGYKDLIVNVYCSEENTDQLVFPCLICCIYCLCLEGHMVDWPLS